MNNRLIGKKIGESKNPHTLTDSVRVCDVTGFAVKASGGFTDVAVAVTARYPHAHNNLTHHIK